MPAHRTAPRSAPETDELPPTAPHSPQPPHDAPAPAPDTATDVVRWAAFSCVLVPVVLVWYGTSLAGATGAALGLAAVTGVCRVLLRQSERGAARAARTARSMTEDRTPRHGRRGRSASGAHRGGRNSGPSTPVD
ncbi:hypothetical protein F9278_16800 [Streptomyces phaeolivaceus]|uniref:Uncharacterized protein n=1 Tax=Streptomyces phaeolivaceus TaxID=2653200 RepID=A0A5P8K2W4_9ACTN|nr:hypothetical protein [Streptomyces phaeolivaceus]QFQ97605.1 hypothetical protein F9278_16800 [Streptomyces phaeolivaceus]